MYSRMEEVINICKIIVIIVKNKKMLKVLYFSFVCKVQSANHMFKVLYNIIRIYKEKLI